MKTIWIYLLILMFGLSLGGCSDKIDAAQPNNFQLQSLPVAVGKISEAAPPPIFEELNKSLQRYNPQVKIVSPRYDQIFKDNQVSVKLQIQDLPIFKHPELGMGPHLTLILDNESYREIYDIDKPILLENLAPGTHTLRVFASRPWHESFKNEGAFAQTTFHILTKTANNNPDRSLPLLTYSRPNGTYGAEPILLDFYLTNAPLHLVTQENPDVRDWRIRVTINGESFVLDRWQAIYLKGLEKGNNWVQLEFIDEDGNNIDNVFNNTVRLITYDPKQQDTLAKLVQGKLSVEVARAIVEPNYQAKPIPAPKIEKTPQPEPEIPATKPSEEAPKAEIPETKPTPTPIAPLEPEPVEQPKAEVPPQPEVSIPEVKETPTEINKIETPESEETVEKTPAIAPEILPEDKPVTQTPLKEKPQWLGNLQNRWQQVKQSVSKSVSEIELPKIELPKPTVKTTPPSQEVIEEKSEAIENTEILEQQTTVENEIQSES
jgi:hypothetical protein